MAERVFDVACDTKVVPSRFGKSFETPLPSLKDMQHVFMELPKMVWFLCCDLWDRWTGVNVGRIRTRLHDTAQRSMRT